MFFSVFLVFMPDFKHTEILLSGHTNNETNHKEPFMKGALSMNLCVCNEKLPSPGPGLQLAIASVPMQPWETPYDGKKALKQGTIFPCLDLPFFAAGGVLNG